MGDCDQTVTTLKAASRTWQMSVNGYCSDQDEVQPCYVVYDSAGAPERVTALSKGEDSIFSYLLIVFGSIFTLFGSIFILRVKKRRNTIVQTDGTARLPNT